MKVRSPVGEFPFEAKRLTLANGRLVVEGAMGAWPATVEVEPKDLLLISRLIPWPVFAGAAVALAGLLRLPPPLRGRVGVGGRRSRRSHG